MYTINPVAVNSAQTRPNPLTPLLRWHPKRLFLVHRKRKATSVLQHTFCHAPGLGPQNERLLWDKGLRTWRDLLWSEQVPLTPHKADALIDTARRSTHHLSERNPHFFYENLPAREHWRLFAEFRDDTAYFDIETTGLGGPEDHITTIVLYDGQQLRHYVHGINMDQFAEDVARYKVLVSYNGKSFDAPFVRRCLQAPLDQPHIDLRYVLSSMGLKGGLKGCERQLGIDRRGLEDIDGFFAVLLWNEYWQRGDEKALHTLLAYNALDVINLESLMVIAYNQKLASTPFAESTLPAPQTHPLPFEADHPTIRRLKAQYDLY